MKKLIYSLFLLCYSFNILYAQAENLHYINNDITIAPNPSHLSSELSFLVKKEGMTYVNIYSVDGKQIASVAQNLIVGRAVFQIQVPKGMYIINVRGNGFNYSTKLLSKATINYNDDKVKLISSIEDFNDIPISKPQKVVSNFLPTVTTAVSNVTSTGALFLGEVTDQGASTVTARGFIYSTYSNAKFPKTSVGGGIGTYQKIISNLVQGTIYYVRSYATNSYGTAYGNEVSFRALAVGDTYQGGRVFYMENNGLKGFIAAPDEFIATKPWQPNYGGNYIATGAVNTQLGKGRTNTQLITSVLGNVDCAATYCNNLIVNGFDDWFMPSIEELTIFHDMYYATIPQGVYVSSTELMSDVSQALSIPVFSTGIQSSYRTISTNDLKYYYPYTKDISYLKVLPIREFPSIPEVSTVPVTNITNATATSGCSLINNGGGPVLSYGICWSTSPNPSINDFVGTSQLTGLSANTTYYVRAYATTTSGIGYGNQQVFTTQPFTYGIGQYYQGGIIAYVFQPGDPGYIYGQIHGIIATPNDYRANWGCEIYPTTSVALNSGSTNTMQIMSAMANCDLFSNYAAKFCSDLVLNGYSDWFLPSKEELNKLFINLYPQHIGDINSPEYLSSSSDTNGVWYQIVPNYSQQTSGGADASLNVRPIRYF